LRCQRYEWITLTRVTPRAWSSRIPKDRGGKLLRDLSQGRSTKCARPFAKRFTVLEFETKVDAQNVQDLFTNRFKLFRVRDEGRCTKCSGGSESSLHRISFSIVKSLPKRSLLEHTQKDLYSGLPQVKECFSYAHWRMYGGLGEMVASHLDNKDMF
jgi:hypothetical protein